MIGKTVLDPRISYDCLREDAEADSDTGGVIHLDESRDALREYYQLYYASQASQLQRADVGGSTLHASPKKDDSFDFTARYKRRSPSTEGELEVYFKLSREDIRECDPVRWWGSRCGQFPNLSRLARDLLTIPGKLIAYSLFVYVLTSTIADVGCAVAVERIFSGGRDTISIRRANLKPETIRLLMVTKQRLHMARDVI